MRTKEEINQAAVSAASLNEDRAITLTPDRLGHVQSGGGSRIAALNSHRATVKRDREPTWRYVTRTVKTHVCVNGQWILTTCQETVRVPYLKPRATPVYAPRATTVRATQRLDHSECAGMPMAQDLNEM